MAATSEMWLIHDAPGLAEMRRFNARLAKELAVTWMHRQCPLFWLLSPGARKLWRS